MSVRSSWQVTALTMAALLSSVALAHEPYMDCFDNGDGTIACEAGYEDGSPPGERDRFLLKDAQGNKLLEGRFDADGRYAFERPEGDFMMIFLGGTIGHSKRINSSALIRQERE